MLRISCALGKDASKLQRSRAVCRIRGCGVLGKTEARLLWRCFWEDLYRYDSPGFC